MNTHEITFNTNLSEAPRTQADFIYKITPTLISITDTGLGQRTVVEDIETVLHKIEYWHRDTITSFKIMSKDGKGFWHEVHWDGTNASYISFRRNRRAKCPQEASVIN